MSATPNKISDLGRARRSNALSGHRLQLKTTVASSPAHSSSTLVLGCTIPNQSLHAGLLYDSHTVGLSAIYFDSIVQKIQFLFTLVQLSQLVATHFWTRLVKSGQAIAAEKLWYFAHRHKMLTLVQSNNENCECAHSFRESLILASSNLPSGKNNRCSFSGCPPAITAYYTVFNPSVTCERTCVKLCTGPSGARLLL
jgi:hypothetical protein